MASKNGLDFFTIAFGSDGLKEFEKEIEYNEKQLDLYDKKVKETESILNELTEAGATNSDVWKESKKTLEELRKEADHYRNTLDKLKNTNQYAFSSMQKSFMKLVETIGLFAVVRSTLTKSLDFYEQAEQLDFLAQKTGVASEKLQELANVTKRYGGTTEGTAGSVENIRTNREEYTKAGIRIEEDPAKTLENVAQKMEKLKSDTEKWQLAESLGIDEATTRLLIEGVDKYNESLKKSSKYKLYTKEDIQRMREYRQIQQDIRDGTNNIFGAIYRLLLPAITAVAKVIRAITDWLSEHEGLTKMIGIFVAIAAAIGLVTSAVFILNAAIGLLEKHPIVLIIIAIIAAITLLIAIEQDFITFLQGGESIIGDILKKFGVDVDAVRQSCLNFFQDVQQGVNNVIDWLKFLGGGFADIAAKAKAMWDAIPEPLKKLIGMSNSITAAHTAVTTGKEIVGKANNNPANAVPAGAQSTYYNAQTQNQNNNQNSKNMVNNQKKNVNATITINTQASDAKAVAKEVGNTLDSLDNGQIG